MFKVSDLISSPVISLYESEYQGIIYNILFDFKLKKVKYLCILNEDDGMQKVLKVNDIFSIGQECIFIKNNTFLELECNYESEINNYNNPLNLTTYNTEGKRLGISTDLILDEKFNINSILLNNGETIKCDHLLNIGKNIILIDSNNINISKLKPKQKNITRKNTNNKVTILSNTNTIQPCVSTPIVNTQKIITDFRFLIGRILQKDIFAINGELIAKNGSTITKDMVNKASSYGKLVEVARYSNKKTNQ